VVLLSTFIAWASFAKVDIVASASGKVVPAGGSKVVQPLETATVTAILVRDGMMVHQGDVLVKLEPTEPLANQIRAGGEFAAAELEAARLRAVALGTPFKAPAGSDAKSAAIADREARAEIADQNAKIEGLTEEIAQHRASLNEAQGEIDRLGALLPLAQRRVAILQNLNDRGFGSSLQLIEAKEKEQDTARSLEVQRRKLPELEAQIAVAERSLAQTKAEGDKTSLAALAEAEVKAASLKEELAKTVERLKGRTLEAPVDGTVQELAIHTVGGVVTPGQVLMRIAPSNSHLEVEAKLANKDIGFVRPGMSAELKVQTFPFTRYGLIPATVVSVSQDALTEPKPQDAATAQPAQLGEGEAHYLLRLHISRDTMEVDGRRISLTPGMIVTAEIKTGRRRVIDFVLSPLAKATGEAGRER